MKILHYSPNTNIAHSFGSFRHHHSGWEIVYRIFGTSNTTIDNQTYHISPGDLYLVPPYVYHSDQADSPFSDFAILVDFLDFSDVLILHDYETYVSSLTQMIHRTMLEKEYNYLNIANSLMEALYQYIKKLSLSMNQNPVIYKLKNTIFSNIENTDFDLSAEIKNTGFHPDYIRRCFKAETGKTPLMYLTELRISKAKQLLVLHGYESIENVAANCGFQDSFYFSTCFKKHVGQPPLQYRKKNLESMVNL